MEIVSVTPAWAPCCTAAASSGPRPRMIAPSNDSAMMPVHIQLMIMSIPPGKAYADRTKDILQNAVKM